MREITKHFYLDKATCLNKYASDDYNKYQSYLRNLKIFKNINTNNIYKPKDLH